MQTAFTFQEVIARWAGITDEEEIEKIQEEYGNADIVSVNHWWIDRPAVAKCAAELKKAMDNKQLPFHEHPFSNRKTLVDDGKWKISGYHKKPETRPANLHPAAFWSRTDKLYKVVAFDRPALKQWFIEYVEERPAFLFPATKEKATGEHVAQGQPYLNENHPNYAPELALAVKAWMHFYSGGKLPKSPKKTVMKWVKDQGGKIELQDRISTLIMPKRRKHGGGIKLSEDD